MNKRESGVHLATNTEKISVTLPSWLLEIMDKVACQKDFNRSCFVKKAVKDYILHQMNNNQTWELLYRELLNK